jgi:hypothetical protein
MDGFTRASFTSALWLAAAGMVLGTFGGAYAEYDPEFDVEWNNRSFGSDFDSEYASEGNWWNKPIWCTECCEYPVWWEWMPELPILMRPFIADPRQITFSAGWRFDDQALVKNVIPVSFADSFPIIRWHNVWPWCGCLEIDLDGAVWAVFDPLHDSSPLMNADYYGGLSITYAIENWQFRLRGFHISSHIGDEFLLNHPHFRRLNPSAEYLDFFISNDLTDQIRIYAGLGYMVAQDESFHVKPFYVEGGAEVRAYDFGFSDPCGKVYGTPFFAFYMRHNGSQKHHIDMTYALGYEIGKTYGLERRMRVYMEYHDGYSLEGQHAKCPTNYFALRLTYGF